MLRPTPSSTLLPYTTLFRSEPAPAPRAGGGAAGARGGTDDGGRVQADRGSRGRRGHRAAGRGRPRSEEHTSELQSLRHLVCRLLLEKKKTQNTTTRHHNTLK